MPIPEHIRRLRAAVGTSLLLVPTVAAIVFDERRRLLLARTADTGRWTTPGGIIDPDEAPADAAAREAFEETGVLVEPVRLVGVYGGPAFHITYPNGDEISAYTMAFEARRIGGELRADGEEMSEIGFFPEDEARALTMSPWARIIVDDAFRPDTWPCFARPTVQPPAGGARS